MPAYYDFCCRVKTISGKNAMEKIPGLLKGLGARRPMIVTDRGVEAAGLIDTVTDAIGENLDIGALYADIPIDSDYRVVDDAASVYQNNRCDAIIAVGGGSVIDTAKGINVVASLGGKSILGYQGAGTIRRKLNPLAVLPTTSGTGSEMTLVAVIADTERQEKMLFVSYFLLPDLAVLDPRLTRTLPDFLTSQTAMDALAHACESYYCMEKNPVSDALAFRAIALISEHLLPAVRNPADTNARLALANASAMAGAAFSNSMVGIVHNIGHVIGAVCHIPHGTCMSILLPYGLEYNIHRRAKAIGEILLPLAGASVYAKTPENARPEKAVEQIRKLNEDLHNVTGGKHPRWLGEIRDREGAPAVPCSVLPEIARKTMADGARLSNPEEVLPDDALMVLEHAWEGTPIDHSRIRKGA